MPRWAPAFMLVVAPVLLHWPHLSGWLSENPAYLMSGLGTGAVAGHGVLAGYPGWIDGNAGVTLQALGGLAARDWLAGVVPWWNPYSGVGLPLAAEGQNGAFLLPFVLLLRLFDGVVYLKIVLQVIAGLACYALARELRLARLASLVGGLGFALNGSFAWFAHGPILPIAFLPLLLFGIERARREPLQGAAWVGVAIGWSLLAGFPETAYLDGLLGLAWLGVRGLGGGGWRLAGAVMLGGIAGVLVAAPPVMAFAQSLPLSFVGNHADFRAAVLAPAARATLLVPYLFGPPMFGGLRLGGAASLAQFVQWFRTAGYLDLPLLACACMALPRRGEADRALRWMLAGWIVLGLGRAIGAPGIAAAVNLLPLVRRTMASLYIVPSCQLAIVVLGAIGIDGWQRGRLSRGRALAGVILAGLAGLGSLGGAWPSVVALSHIHLYALFPLVSLAAAGGVLGGCAVLLRGAADARRGAALGMLVTGYAAALFSVPLLAGTPRPRGLDQRAVAYLAHRGGPVRVHAIGVLSPNYGAWFGIGAIDHNYLPVPQAWVDDVRATLLPGMDGVNNYGDAADPRWVEALRARLPALQAHGVTDVMLPAGAGDVFAGAITVPVRTEANRAWVLTRPLAGEVPGGRVVAGRAGAVAVDIGTFAGAARGTLMLRLCQGGRCAQGSAQVGQATDNAALVVPLASSLDLVAGVGLSYAIAMAPGSARPAAVWLWPAMDAARMAGGAGAPAMLPRLVVRLAPPAGAPVPVYADALVGIFGLPHPAAYAAAPGCRVVVASWTEMVADCGAASRLRRLELAFPGWRVRRDGAWSAVGSDGLYQSVALPGGVSHLVFRYAPPWVLYAWVACAVGVSMLAGCGWLGWAGGRSIGRRAMIGRSTRRLSA